MRIIVNYNKYVLNNPQKCQRIWKNLKNSLKVTVLSRTSRNWCTDPIHVIHQSMRVNVKYNKYVLNNPQKYQKKIEKISKIA
jgi:hypothetical protein